MLNTLTHIINQGESQIVEFKTSSQKEVIESVVAFANSKGGNKNIYYKRLKNSNHLMGLMEITNMNLQSLQLSLDSYLANDTSFEEMENGYLVTLCYEEQNTTRELILELLKEDKKLTRGELAKVIGVLSSAIKQHLSKL